jgi:hypothetical protein
LGTIFYRLYQPCGLFNQLTSLELAIGLSNRYNKSLVIHNINNPYSNEYKSRVPVYSANYKFNDRRGLVDTGVFPRITELVNWKNKEQSVFIDDSVDKFTEENLVIENLMMYYSSDDDNLKENESDFSENREKLLIGDFNNIHLKNTLGYYSRFFFNRNTELDSVLSSIRFDEGYYELAEQIARSIGDFNGSHFRLTDHKSFFDPDINILDSGLNRLDNSLPIVMCTDQQDSEIVKNSSYKFLLLDNYILNNFYKEFRQFKFKEEVSFGILNNLVMHYSKDFIGSPGSTYTGYIYRSINQKQELDLKLFMEDPHTQNGIYSWNGYNNKDIYTKQWWREWKESKLNV